MDYAITVITLNSPIPTGPTGNAAQTPFGKFTPYSESSQKGQLLDFANAERETLHVGDGDTRLDGYAGAKSAGAAPDLDQVVSKAITLGYGDSRQDLLVGQRIGFDYSAHIFQIDQGKIVAVFEIAFPRIPAATEGSVGTIVGSKYSMMVIPVPYKTSAGNELAPVPFDLSKTYYFGNNLPYSKTDYSIDYSFDCFATGTLIDTATGPRPVETLRAGDRVETRDHGAQALLWAGTCRVDAARLDLQPNLRPVRIAAGALAPRCPASDLVLSPQHRVLVRSSIALRMFDTPEVLVAVKHLVGLPGIEVLVPPGGVGYHHLLFAGHEVVRSDGAWTESLFLGPQAMKGLDPSARREVMALFPELAARGAMPEPARRLLCGREGRKLAERHGRNRKPLVEPVSEVAQPLLPA